jgi:hypothetical protein
MSSLLDKYFFTQDLVLDQLVASIEREHEHHVGYGLLPTRETGNVGLNILQGRSGKQFAIGDWVFDGVVHVSSFC